MANQGRQRPAQTANRRVPATSERSSHPSAERAAPFRRQAPNSTLGLRHPWIKLTIFVMLCGLPGLGLAHLLATAGTWAWLVPWMLGAYLATSLATLALYGYDKRQARLQGQRIPERCLHLFELCGGWPGALLAQQLWRHKTRKLTYQAVFWLIVAIHQGLWLMPVLNARLAG